MSTAPGRIMGKRSVKDLFSLASEPAPILPDLNLCKDHCEMHQRQTDFHRTRFVIVVSAKARITKLSFRFSPEQQAL